MTSSLHKIYKFGDFSSDIDYNSKTDIFSGVIYFFIDQCEPRRPKGASGGHILSTSHAANKRSTLVYIKHLKFEMLLRNECFKITFDFNFIDQ